MARPRSLTPVVIAAAALTVLEREGLTGLSMRTVARELGVGTMSLYRYVDGREQLERLIVERVLTGVELELPQGAPWTRRVSLLLERVRAVVEAHPSVVPLLLTRRHTTDASLRWGEALLGALAEGGFQGKARVIAFRTLLSYLFGAVQVEHLGSLSGEGTAALAALPREQYPVLAETAAHARRLRPGEEFRRGLEAVLRGLGAAGAERR
ncbi:MAG TPA: TetR/AcrR family transcriptional regulator C-terminal domain-containing protein [Aggregicoccus sp.]|nr:TetR/AcrR family transcriptional regulator C-terminal domain-containing protein [Aggregicoccus sp.]